MVKIWLHHAIHSQRPSSFKLDHTSAFALARCYRKLTAVCKILVAFVVDQVGMRMETDTTCALSSVETVFLQALTVIVKGHG